MKTQIKNKNDILKSNLATVNWVLDKKKIKEYKGSEMKILAICGSPRKGATYAVLNSIKSNFPTIDVEIMMLNNMTLEMCKGCYACVLRGEGNCPLKDDRDKILKKMRAADGVIFASPVYVNHISAIMKSFFERLGYNSHRPSFFDNYAMVLSVCKGFGTKQANKYMKDIVGSFGFNVVSSLGLQYSTKTDKEDIYNFKKIFDSINTFTDRIKRGERNPPTIANLVMFNLFKYVSETYKKKYKADYAYYKDKSEYPYNGRINFFKKWIAKRYVKRMTNEIALHH